MDASRGDAKAANFSAGVFFAALRRHRKTILRMCRKCCLRASYGGWMRNRPPGARAALSSDIAVVQRIQQDIEGSLGELAPPSADRVTPSPHDFKQSVLKAVFD